MIFLAQKLIIWVHFIFYRIFENVKIIRENKHLKKREVHFQFFMFFCNCDRSFFHNAIFSPAQHSDAFDFFPKNVLCMTTMCTKKSGICQISGSEIAACWMTFRGVFMSILFIGVFFPIICYFLIVNQAKWKWKFHFAINAFRVESETLFSCHTATVYTCRTTRGDWFKSAINKIGDRNSVGNIQWVKA